jgi:hypothetical protein
VAGLRRPHWSDRARTAGHETPTPRRRPAVRAHHPEHNGLASTSLGGTGVPTGARASSPRRTAEGTSSWSRYERDRAVFLFALLSFTGRTTVETLARLRRNDRSIQPASGNNLSTEGEDPGRESLSPPAATVIIKSREDVTESRHEAADSRTRHPADLDLRRDRTAATTTAADTRTSTPEVPFRSFLGAYVTSQRSRLALRS